MRWLQCAIFVLLGLSLGHTGSAPEGEHNELQNLISEKDCSLGPSLWCLNLKAADVCNAVEHCKQTVWSKSILKVDDSPTCQECTHIMQEIKDGLNNNLTIDQLEIALKTLCYFTGPLKIECEYGVSKVLPKLKDFIKTADPQFICKSCWLCNTDEHQFFFDLKKIKLEDVVKDRKSVAEVKPKKAEDKKLTCANCFTLFTTSKKMLARQPQDMVLNKMIEFCGEMGSYSDSCAVTVITYFTPVFEMMKSAQVGEICHLSGSCDELYHFHETTPELQTAIDNAPNEANDEVCDFCEAMVVHLKDLLVANSTKEQFKDVLEGICKQTGAYSTECMDLVKQYYEIIYDVLMTELNAPKLCKEVGLCKAKVDVSKGVSIPPFKPSGKDSVDLDRVLSKELASQAEKKNDKIHKVELQKDEGEFKTIHHLVGASKCTWGPSYWCQNITSTRDCKGSLKHCIEKVWEKEVLPVDNGNMCTLCKDMVTQARDQLKSNETQEELKEVLEGSCALIPIKIAAKECKTAVDEFIPELVETLASQMNPQIVCATVGLCNNAKLDSLIQKELAEKEVEVSAKEASPVQLPMDRMFPELHVETAVQEEVMKRSKEACTICNLFLHYVQQQMTLPQSEEKIKAVVDQVCTKLPEHASSQCTSFIEVYGDDFISLLAQEIDPATACPSIGACPTFLAYINKQKPSCPLCLLAVQSLENKIENNKTEQAVTAALETLCHTLPKHLKGECDSFVEKYTNELVDAMIADFTPQETCLYLKMCNPPQAVTAKLPEVEESEVEPHAVSPIEKAIETNRVPGTDEKEGLTGNSCVLCEFVMDKLDKELKDRDTEDQIEHDINTVCKHLPTTVRGECMKFVSDYGDLIFQLLSDSLEPEAVCRKLKFCPNKASVTGVEKTTTKCVICEALIGVVEGLSTDATVQRVAMKDLQEGCRKLPHKYENTCLDIVYQLGPQLLSIIQSVPAEFVCSKAGLCSKYAQKVKPVPNNCCILGPSCWCDSTTNAASCGPWAIEYCQLKVWMAAKPKTKGY